MTTRARIEPRRLKGFRDYLPDQMATRTAIVDAIRAEARIAGYAQIGTPALEYADTLLGQGSDETDKQVYRFKDHGDRDVALRFDLTVPFARFVAEHQSELFFPFKKLHIGEVWRGENTQKGRYREFCQCDLDIIGVDSASADVEILSTFHKILGRVATGPFTISVGNRVILSALIKKALPTLENETAALIALDKLAKIGRDKVGEMLAALAGASAAGAEALLGVLLTKIPTGDSDIQEVEQFLGGEPAAQAEIDRLKTVLHTVRGLAMVNADDPKVAPGRLALDLTIARGLGYYTGIVFETTLDELPGFGSVCSGGRYNGLASRFSSRELPGVGASVGLDRLLGGLEELGRIQPARKDMIFVAVATDDAMAYAFQLAETLRHEGIVTDVGLTAKLGGQFKHADRLGCPFVLTVGSEERLKRTYAMKSMKTGTEERDLPLAEVVGKVQALLATL